MSLIFIDGFDHYNAIRDKWQVAAGLTNPTFVAGRFGIGQALRHQASNNTLTMQQTFPSQTEVFFGIALQAPGFPSSSPHSMFRFNNTAGTNLVTVSLNVNGTLTIACGGQSATTVAPITNVQYHFIELRYTAKNTGGICELRVDEAVVATITGDTTTSTEDDIAIFSFGHNGSNAPLYLFDDLYILNASGTTNNGYLGDSRITTLVANLDGTNNDFAPSTGSLNFEMVDEVIMDSDTTHVESGLVGAQEDYDNESFSDRAITPGTIFGVQVANATKRTNVGALRYQNEMTVAGVQYTDAIEYTAGQTAYFVTVLPFDTDPSDSGAWTEAKVAACGSGLKITFKDN